MKTLEIIQKTCKVFQTLAKIAGIFCIVGAAASGVGALCAVAQYHGGSVFGFFGEAFYTDSFHAGIPHEELLRGIRCKTLLLKAKTVIGQDDLLMAALGESDLRHVLRSIPNCRHLRFDCGHAIHIEKPKEFIAALSTLA